MVCINERAESHWTYSRINVEEKLWVHVCKNEKNAITQTVYVIVKPYDQAHD